MRFAIKGAVLGAAALFALAAPMAAQAVDVDVGPAGIHLGRDHHHYYHHDRGCREVITHRTNRFGDDVTVRRRICD